MTVWSNGVNLAVQNSLVVGDLVDTIVSNVTGQQLLFYAARKMDSASGDTAIQNSPTE